MTKTSQNFSMWAGETKILTITIAGSGSISGATIDFAMGTEPDGSPSVITKATGGSGIVITDATNRIIQVTLDASDTSTILGTSAYINYHYQVRMTLASVVTTVTTGTIKVNKSNI